MRTEQPHHDDSDDPANPDHPMFVNEILEDHDKFRNDLHYFFGQLGRDPEEFPDQFFLRLHLFWSEVSPCDVACVVRLLSERIHQHDVPGDPLLMGVLKSVTALLELMTWDPEGYC